MKIIIAVFSLVLSLVAGDIDPKQFNSVKMFAQPHIKVTKAYDHGNLYELQVEVDTSRGTQSTSAFLTKDKKVVFFGEAMDANTGESIKRPLDMKSIRANADLVYGSGSKEYIVFTDPECSYCVKFEKTWPSLERKVKLYVYFMPLSHHRSAVQMSYYVMKQKDQKAKAQAILSMAHGDRSYERLSMSQQISDLFSQKIDANKALADEFGVRGTPSVFDTKGESVMWNRLGQ